MRCPTIGILLLAAWSAVADPQPEIHIEDAPPRLADNIRAHLGIGREPCDRPLARLRSLRYRIEREVDAAARALGYYHLRIVRLEFQRGRECWRLTLKIVPGPRVRVARLRLAIEGEAADDPEFRKLQRDPPIRPGDPLDHGRYERLKLMFHNLALRRGYFDARFRVHELKVDPARNRAEIDLVFDSGPRYRIGPIQVRQDFLDPAFLDRYLGLEPGRPYEASVATELYRRLAATDLFRQIEIKTRPVRRPRPEVVVSVVVKPKKRHRFKVGLGFDTDTGPRIRFGYLDRYLNRRGHRFQADLKLSPVDPGVTGSYRIPLAGPEERLDFNAGFRHLRLDTYRANQGTFNATYLHPRGAWSETVRLGLSYERSHFKNKAEPVSSLMLVPSLHWTHERLRRPGRFVVRGRKFDFLTGGGVALLGDGGHYLKAHLRGSYIFSLPWHARVLHRWELGALFAPRFSSIPAGTRFYAGGNRSIRGYGYRRLGPKNDEGHVTGGRYLGTVSLEYEQRFLRNWGLALFLDAGNAYDRLGEIAGQVRFGAGVGIRWFSPVGVVRLDFATPVWRDRPRLRIHFALGPEL